jgi:hypothetical protein
MSSKMRMPQVYRPPTTKSMSMAQAPCPAGATVASTVGLASARGKAEAMPHGKTLWIHMWTWFMSSSALPVTAANSSSVPAARDLDQTPQDLVGQRARLAVGVQQGREVLLLGTGTAPDDPVAEVAYVLGHGQPDACPG